MPSPFDTAYNPSNQWGDQVWYNPYTSVGPGVFPQLDIMADQDPQAVVRDAFAQMGHGNRLNNPWVRYMYNDVAPDANLLYAGFGGGGAGEKAGTLSSEGMYDWMRGLVGGGIRGQMTSQNPNAGGTQVGAGTVGANQAHWVNYKQFADLARNLAAGTGPQALTAYLKGQSGEDQAATLAKLYGAAGAMSMNRVAQAGMKSGLAEKLSDYKSRMASGSTASDQGFLDYLDKSGFNNQWFGNAGS